MKKYLNPLVITGLTALVITGSTLFVDVYRAYWGDQSIWWTPLHLALPLEKTRDQLEIYLGDTLLQQALTQHQLFAVGPDGQQYPVVAEDIQVRLNNWYEVKANLLSRVVFLGAPFGAALALFLVGLGQTFSKTKG
ncbi:MAG: hypothetical protein IT487_09460 [Chromatiaceae bacterium]|nr:hypothetical protein [Chromatiaceae bacterium]